MNNSITSRQEVSQVNTIIELIRNKQLTELRNKFSLEFKFCLFADENFAKFKFHLLLYFWKSLNDSLYN